MTIERRRTAVIKTLERTRVLEAYRCTVSRLSAGLRNKNSIPANIFSYKIRERGNRAGARPVRVIAYLRSRNFRDCSAGGCTNLIRLPAIDPFLVLAFSFFSPRARRIRL